MRSRKILVGIVAMVSLIGCAQAGEKPAKKTENQESRFRKLERKMFDASVKFLNNEKSEFLGIVDEDYWSINADGSSGDKASLSAVKFPVQAMSIDRIESSEFRLRVFGNVAVINGKSFYYSDAQNVAEVLHTQIWVKRKSGWKLAGWQGTMVKSPDPKKQ